MKTTEVPPQKRYDIVALVSNDLVTDQRMQRCLTSLQYAGFDCLLLGRKLPTSKALNLTLPYDQERHQLQANSGKLFYWQLNRAHYRRLRELEPRAILVVDLDTMGAGASAARALDVPWIYDAHELFTEVPEVARRPWIRTAWQWLARRYIPQAAACYTVGEAIAEEFARRYGRAFAVVRNYTATPAANPLIASGESKTGFIVLYQGALNEGRGLEELIEAAASLPDITFWLVGTGDLEAELQRRARELRLNNVVFHGQVSPEQLRLLTPRAHLGYGLMRNVSLNYYLSLSNKSIDYVHAGLPSLQMAWPEYEAIQQRFKCYYLVDHLTTASIIEAIAAVREPRRYANLVAACGDAAQHLTWASQEATLLAVWTKICPPRR